MTDTDSKSDPTKDPEFQKVVRRMLRTPPKPRKSSALLHDGDHFLVIDDKIRIAHEAAHNEDGSITVDLYRNVDDYRAGRAMERDFTYRP